jgi:hypothetical protein
VVISSRHAETAAKINPGPLLSRQTSGTLKARRNSKNVFLISTMRPSPAARCADRDLVPDLC